MLDTLSGRHDDAGLRNVAVMPVIVFDVNETLLDLHSIQEWFDVRFAGEMTASHWFGELLRLSFVSAATDRYVPFTALAAHALSTSASANDVEATADDIETIASLMLTLSPHADSRPGIQGLVDAGFTVAALTNSPQDTASAQLQSAGLDDLLDPIMSVEMVERFKPHASVYRAAARRLNVETSDMVMVAAHDWDIAGAMAAGCKGVFIDRGGRAYSSAFARPSMVARDIRDAAEQLIRLPW